MKRIIAAIVLFGLLGAVTSIGIAWWMLLRPQVWGDERPFEHEGWIGWQQECRGVTLVAAASRDHRSWTDAVLPEIKWDPDHELPAWSALRDDANDKSMWLQEFAAGWPLKCLRCIVREGEVPSVLPFADGSREETDELELWRSHRDKREKRVPEATNMYTGAIVGKNPQGGSVIGWTDRLLPVAPIWPSLLLSSALYGSAAAFLLLRIPHAIRLGIAASRRRRGLCPVCKYNRQQQLRGVCQECGSHVTHRPRVTATSSFVLTAAVTLAVVGWLIVVVMRFDDEPPFRPIHRAAYEGDLAGVQSALNAGADPSEVCDYEPHEGPLHLAVRSGNVDVVRALIDAGAVVDATDRYRRSPLAVAMMREGSDEIVRCLLGGGANPNGEAYWREAPLQIALDRDASLEVVQALLDAGAHVNLEDIYSGLDRETVESDEFRAQHDYETPLTQAARQSRADVVRAVLDAGADLSHSTALSAACRSGSMEIAQMLLDAGADVEPRIGPPPLVWAAYGGHTDVVQLLLDHGAKIDADVMVAAGGAPSLRVIGKLIAKGGDIRAVDGEGRNAMSFLNPDPAARPVWEFLAAQGLRVQNIDVEGWTAIHRAVGYEAPELTAFLLEHGADPSMRTAEGTPLEMIIDRRLRWQREVTDDALRDTIAVLVEHGVDIDARDDGDETILKKCVRDGAVDLVRVLLEFDPAIDEVLHYARQKRHEEIAELLMEEQRSRARSDVPH